MSIVPKGRVKRIMWYQLRAAKWAEDPAAIGVTPEDVAALQAIVEEARVAQVEQSQTHLAARNATLRRNIAIKTLTVQGSAMLKLIRARAESSGNRNVYPKASIPTPRRKSHIGKPGMPAGFKFTMEQAGGLNLSWTCDNPRGAEGTTYHVYRQLDNAGPFIFLGHAGKKKFRDKTLPAGVSMVTYKIQAVRSTGAGTAAEFHINFGGGGRAIAEVRIAA